MGLFQWSQTYCVGHPEIDSQHKRVFQIAEQLDAAVAAGKPKPFLNKTLGDLIAYTKRHLADEEILMQNHRYGEYPLHKAEHQALVQKLAQLQGGFQAGRVEMTPEVLQFLKEWWTHHICVQNRKVAGHLQGLRR